MNFKQLWVWVLVLVILCLGVFLHYEKRGEARPHIPAPVSSKKTRVHLDHSAFFTNKFTSPEEVTASCLKCHPQAASDFMKTAHWQWLGPLEDVPGRDAPMRIGKKNLINNFCISIQGNWAGCAKCHPGYGWDKADYDFSRQDRVDCLVCHDWSSTYVKGPAGLPDKNVDLLAVARSVGYPKRDNCGTCHSFGGGGLGVKHGDLDNSLDNPGPDVDVHMGKEGFLCTDCHRTVKHQIPGRSFSVSARDANGISCADCHKQPPHADERLNRHSARVACAACHIPSFARNVPTKMDWDWSKAGDASRQDDPHHYLKIKGEFRYDNNVIPEYRWFNLSVEHYLQGDKINPDGLTDINRPVGGRADPTARIWPFKIHTAKQPYDLENAYLLPPQTAGKGGFWQTFDWNKSLESGARISGLNYSGKYGFAKTRMYWPLSHGVAPGEQALKCNQCHGAGTRLDWKALGYASDPMGGGRL